LIVGSNQGVDDFVGDVVEAGLPEQHSGDQLDAAIITQFSPFGVEDVVGEEEVQTAVDQGVDVPGGKESSSIVSSRSSARGSSSESSSDSSSDDDSNAQSVVGNGERVPTTSDATPETDFDSKLTTSASFFPVRGMKFLCTVL